MTQTQTGSKAYSLDLYNSVLNSHWKERSDQQACIQVLTMLLLCWVSCVLSHSETQIRHLKKGQWHGSQKAEEWMNDPKPWGHPTESRAASEPWIHSRYFSHCDFSTYWIHLIRAPKHVTQPLHIMHSWKCVWSWFRKTQTVDFCAVKNIPFTTDYTKYEIQNCFLSLRCHCPRCISRIPYMLFLSHWIYLIVYFLALLTKVVGACCNQKIQLLEKYAMQKVKVVWRSQAETHTNGRWVCPGSGCPAKMSKHQNREHEKNGLNSMDIALVGFAKLPSPKVLPRDALANSFEISCFPTPPTLGISKFPHLVKLKGNWLDYEKHTCAPIVSIASTIKLVTQFKPQRIPLKDLLLLAWASLPSTCPQPQWPLASCKAPNRFPPHVCRLHLIN